MIYTDRLRWQQSRLSLSINWLFRPMEAPTLQIITNRLNDFFRTNIHLTHAQLLFQLANTLRFLFYLGTCSTLFRRWAALYINTKCCDWFIPQSILALKIHSRFLSYLLLWLITWFHNALLMRCFQYGRRWPQLLALLCANLIEWIHLSNLSQCSLYLILAHLRSCIYLSAFFNIGRIRVHCWIL